ncbi:hypothetical protein ABZX30_31950 [Streptomyces sp. NPDC004542]
MRGEATEAGAVDAAAFERRFGVRLVEGYGWAARTTASASTARTWPPR